MNSETSNTNSDGVNVKYIRNTYTIRDIIDILNGKPLKGDKPDPSRLSRPELVLALNRKCGALNTSTRTTPRSALSIYNPFAFKTPQEQDAADCVRNKALMRGVVDGGKRRRTHRRKSKKSRKQRRKSRKSQ